MIRGCDSHHVGRESVDIEEQRTHDALDLTRLVLVSPLLPDGVELIEEEDASSGANSIKETREPHRCLAEIAANDGLVAHDQQWDRQIARQSLRKGCLAVPRFTHQQDSIPWLDPVRAEQVGSLLLLYQFIGGLPDGRCKDHVSQRFPGHDLQQRT